VGQESFELNTGVVAMPIFLALVGGAVQIINNERKKRWQKLWQEGGGGDSRSWEGAQGNW
jgi:hypothetical protein